MRVFDRHDRCSSKAGLASDTAADNNRTPGPAAPAATQPLHALDAHAVQADARHPDLRWNRAAQGAQCCTRKVARSREQRFNDLIAVHMGDLYRFAYWLSGNRSVAEDLVQETLIRAWKSIDRLKDTTAAKGWLMTIVRRENARRFARRQVQESGTPTDDLAAGRSNYDTSTEAFVLRRALDRLPTEYREPLLMQVIYGYSQKEIAEQLGISNAGAGTRLFRAREKMRALL
jgi:RNA polymerase sigma-70 factor (ECF subfamily)